MYLCNVTMEIDGGDVYLRLELFISHREDVGLPCLRFYSEVEIARIVPSAYRHVWNRLTWGVS